MTVPDIEQILQLSLDIDGLREIVQQEMSLVDDQSLDSLAYSVLLEAATIAESCEGIANQEHAYEERLESAMRNMSQLQGQTESSRIGLIINLETPTKTTIPLLFGPIDPQHQAIKYTCRYTKRTKIIFRTE